MPVVQRDIGLTHSAVKWNGHSERTSLEASEGGERYKNMTKRNSRQSSNQAIIGLKHDKV